MTTVRLAAQTNCLKREGIPNIAEQKKLNRKSTFARPAAFPLQAAPQVDARLLQVGLTPFRMERR
jgi:hypothetical protein